MLRWEGREKAKKSCMWKLIAMKNSTQPFKKGENWNESWEITSGVSVNRETELKVIPLIIVIILIDSIVRIICRAKTIYAFVVQLTSFHLVSAKVGKLINATILRFGKMMIFNQYVDYGWRHPQRIKTADTFWLLITLNISFLWRKVD